VVISALFYSILLRLGSQISANQRGDADAEQDKQAKDMGRPLAERNSPPACGPAGYFNGMRPDQNSAGR